MARITHTQAPLTLRLASLVSCAAAATVVLVGTVAVVQATMVVPLGLARVTREAARVVQGQVTAVRAGRDEAGLPATWVTVAVARTLKGPAEAGLTFKQYGVATPLPDGTVTRVAGLPRYQVGEEVVLFLRGVSRRGFTSPVGLGEGVYRVRRGGAAAQARSELPAGERRQDLDAFLAEVARLAASQP